MRSLWATGQIAREGESDLMAFGDRLKARWGVGPWNVVAILLAFAAAGTTTLKLKDPVVGFLLPADTPGWLAWPVYVVIVLPIYQVLLLAYGALLGQGRFFWTKLTALGRRLGRVAG